MATCNPVRDTLNNAPYNMGMGKLGDTAIDIKRKFRWLMAISFCKNSRTVPPHFVKVASRPDLSVEDTELNFLNSKTWIAGKATWEQISVTYIDVATDDNIELWSWIGTVYNFFSLPGTTPCYTTARRDQYQGIMELELLDGCGNIIESWQMQNAWPTSIKFGELDYSQSETVDIELQLRYSQVAYRNLCGRQPNPCECPPSCASGAGGGFGALGGAATGNIV